MKWIKQALLWLLGLLFLLLIVVSLLGFTHAGNRFLWQQAKAHLPQLKGELVAGQLGYGWTLDDLAWQDELVDVQVRRVELDWDLGQLLKGRLWIKRLEADQPVVKVAESQSEPEPDDGEPFVWRPLPLRIDVDALALHGMQLTLPDLTLALKEGELGAHLTRRGLTLRGPRLDGLHLTMLPATTEAVAPSPAQPDEPAGPITLPEVKLPFPVRIEGLELTDTQYRDGELHEVVSRLTLDAGAEGEVVTLDALTLAHEMVEARLSGHLSLTGDYPLALVLDGTLGKGLLEGELKGETLKLALDGSVADLTLALEAKGPVAATFKGKLAPLDPALPFDASLSWPGLQWPLHKPAAQEASYRLKKGSLTAKGSLDDYRFALASAGEGTDLPPFTLDLKGEGDINQLRKINLTLAALEGSLGIDGKLGWSKGVQWQGKAQFANLNPHALVPELKGALSGQIESRFNLDEKGGWALALPTLKVDGRLNQYPLSLQGELKGNDKMQWQLPALSFTSGPNTVTAHGELQPERWQLDATLAAPQLASLYPGLKGDLNGEVRLRGSEARPELSTQLAGERVYFEGIDLRGVALDGKGVLGEQPAGDVKLNVASLKQEGVELSELALTLQGDAPRHTLTLGFKGEPVASQLRLEGGLTKELWRGRLTQLDLDTPLRRWGLKQPWALDVNTQTLLAHLGEFCLTSRGADLCLHEGQASPQQGSLNLTLANFNLSRLRPWLPDNFQWQAVLSADARASWKGDQHELHARVSTPPGTLVTDDIKTPYRTLALAVDMDSRQAKIDVEFDSEQLGGLRTQVEVRDPQGRGQLGGQLLLRDLKPDAFAPLIPEVRELKGVLAGQARFDGTLKRPLLYGELRLRDGEVQTTSDMVTLTKLDTRLRIDGERADIDGKVLVGKGPLNLGGSLSWASQPMVGRLTIQGSNLEAQYPGMGRLRVTPDIQVSLGEQTEVTGTITVPWARIVVKSLPESAVGLSDDVVIVRDDAPLLPEAAPLPLKLRMQVAIGPDVQLDAMGLRTKLVGQLRLSQDEGKPLAGRGEIVLNDGRFLAYGQNLLIKEGKITFGGPLDQPYLNVDAIRNPSTVEDNVTVGVKVTGLASKPKLTVYSDPAMSESERLSYLLRGKGLQTSGEDGGFNGLLVAGAVGQANGVVSDIGETLGLSDVSLDTAGSGDDTQVTLSAYLLPGLQLQYGVGVFSPIAEFKLRYELMPRLYLQAVTGLAQAVDIFYRFEL